MPSQISNRRITLRRSTVAGFLRAATAARRGNPTFTGPWPSHFAHPHERQLAVMRTVYCTGCVLGFCAVLINPAILVYGAPLAIGIGANVVQTSLLVAYAL